MKQANANLSAEEQAIRDFDNKNGFLAHRWLDDGQLIALIPLTYGRVRITIGPDLMYIRDMW